MQLAGKRRRRSGTADACSASPRKPGAEAEPVRRRLSLAPRPRPDACATRWSIAAPAADWPPSFSQRPGTIAEKYGPQTPGTKAGSLVRRHGAGRGAEHIGHARSARVPASPARADRADAAGMGIDQAGGDRRSRQQAEFGRGAVGQARAERACRRRRSRCRCGAKPSSASAPRPIVAEIAVVPALLMRRDRSICR